MCTGAAWTSLNGTAGVFGCEVVEHDAVGFLGNGFREFLEVAYLALYFQVEALVAAVLTGTCDGVVHAAAEVDVVVLEQDHVEQSDAVVHASADAHGFFLEHAHARRGLPGVEYAGLRAGVDECLLVLMCHGGDAAHALADVEHEPLGGEQALLLAADREHDVAGHDVVAVVFIHGDLEVRVETVEDLLCGTFAGKDAFFLDHKARSRPWHRRECSRVWCGRRHRYPRQKRGR